MPAVFAFADKVIQQPQTSIIAGRTRSDRADHCRASEHRVRLVPEQRPRRRRFGDRGVHRPPHRLAAFVLGRARHPFRPAIECARHRLVGRDSARRHVRRDRDRRAPDHRDRNPRGGAVGLLPIAVLIGSYAPRAISFAAGQAAISLVVGVLFWPRGAAALVRSDLAAAYARAADSVVATARELIEGGDATEAARADRAAETPINVEGAAALVGGAARVRHRTSETPTTGPACSPASAMQRGVAIARPCTQRWCSCGRAIISTFSGGSRRTSANVRTSCGRARFASCSALAERPSSRSAT